MARVGDLTFAVGRETTAGTAVSPTRRFEVLDENLALQIERIESKAIKTGRKTLATTGWAAGARSVEGDFSIEVPSAGFGTLVRALFGSPTTTNNSPVTGTYTHVFNNSSSVDSEFLTCEIVRSDVAGTQHKFTYSGVALMNAEFNAAVNEFVTAKFTVDGMNETVSAAAPTSASYATASPLVFTGATLTVDSSAFAVKAFSTKIDTGRKGDRYFLGSNTKSSQVEAGMREVTGSLDVEWTGLTSYQKFTAGTTAALEVTFQTQSFITGSTYGSVKITLPACRYDGTTPTSNGMDIIPQSIPFKALDDGTNEVAKITVISTDSTY